MIVEGEAGSPKPRDECEWEEEIKGAEEELALNEGYGNIEGIVKDQQPTKY